MTGIKLWFMIQHLKTRVYIPLGLFLNVWTFPQVIFHGDHIGDMNEHDHKPFDLVYMC